MGMRALYMPTIKADIFPSRNSLARPYNVKFLEEELVNPVI